MCLFKGRGLTDILSIVVATRIKEDLVGMARIATEAAAITEDTMRAATMEAAMKAATKVEGTVASEARSPVVWLAVLLVTRLIITASLGRLAVPSWEALPKTLLRSTRTRRMTTMATEDTE